MPRHIVVDGYNVLFAMGRTPQAEDRLYLLNLLASYVGRRQVQVTVVFDRKTGDPAEGRETQVYEGVRVIYTAPLQEADEIIRQIAETSKNPRDMLVVSSDKAGITKYCRKVGVSVEESLRFFEFLRKRPSPQQVSPRDTGDEKPNPGPSDVAYYLDKFIEEK